ncbi:MAG: metabolite traffic protein EboE [Balneolaceae bacterium]
MELQLPEQSGIHLSYCTNIHPGESWNDVFQQLKDNLPALKKRLAPDAPFGIGLRLSAKAAETLLQKEMMDAFRDWLDRENLYVFTMNGFPYGSFHGERVKDRVYKPDWRTEERVQYSIDLAQVLAKLLGEGAEGSISTSPLSYKQWLPDASTRREVLLQSSRNMARVALEMDRIKKETGAELHLDIEPEPDCLIENTDETVSYFNDWLIPEGGRFLEKQSGHSSAEAEQIIRDHIQVCYDTCHFSVEYEEPEEALRRFAKEGIGIGKVQVSAALKVLLGEAHQREAVKKRLHDFAEDVYLHQVIERRDDGSLHHYPDLPEALPGIENPGAQEWRIHYHVPVFLDHFQELQSTRDDIVRSLDYLKKEQFSNHIEVETYTWSVLPDEMRTNLLSSIERELRWTMQELGEK